MKMCGFTLIELMVVITIIAVLAGFSVPAISGALDRSNQTKDLNNIKQLAHVLFMDANDHNGSFRGGSTNTNTSANATDIFKQLLEEKILSSADVIAGFNVPKYEEATLANFASSNVAWAYFAGLTTGDSDKLPILISRGNTITKADLTGDLKTVLLTGTNSNWGTKGIVVAYKGQNAEFKKADKDGNVKLGAGVNPINANADFLQP